MSKLKGLFGEFLFAAILLSLPVTVSSQVIQTRDLYPRVGLVLSGGGARGIAHIGVLKELEAAGIPVDVIAGTSMGSIVAGLYAVGYSAEDLERLAVETDWKSLFTDEPPRQFLPYSEREKISPAIFQLKFGESGFRMAGGIIEGKRISAFLSLLTLGASDVTDFDMLPIPYRAVVTDLNAGKSLVIDHGNLTEAMRASIAIPGFFTPVERDGHVLVDGGVLNNLPVDVARGMGADIVIAVDVAQRLDESSPPADPVSVLTRTVRVFIRHISEERERSADLVIAPELGDVSVFDFENVGELIEKGEAAAAGMSDKFAELRRRIELTRRPGYPKKDRELNLHRIRIDAVEFEGLEPGAAFDRTRFIRELPFEAIGVLDIDRLKDEPGIMFFPGEYAVSSLSYSRDPEKGNVLTVFLEKKTEGSNTLRTGLNYRSRSNRLFSGSLSLAGEVEFRELSVPGASLRVFLRLLGETRVGITFLRPLSHRLFLSPSYSYNDKVGSICVDGELLRLADILESSAHIRFGLLTGYSGAVSLGYGIESTLLQSAVFGEDALLQTAGFLDARSDYDTFDRILFPRRGMKIAAEARLAAPWLGGTLSFGQISGDFASYFPVGESGTLGVRLSLGAFFGSELSHPACFYGGGPGDFPGYAEGTLFGRYKAVSSLEYRHRVLRLPTSLGDSAFVSAVLTGGNFFNEIGGKSGFPGVRASGSVGLGFETVIGSLAVTFAVTSDGEYATSFLVGSL